MSLPIKSEKVEVVSGAASDPVVVAGTADPSAGLAQPEGSVYLRYGAGAGELYVKTGASNNDWEQANVGVITNTLDQAYDSGGPGAGRTITADAGPVEVVATNAAIQITSGALEIANSSPSVSPAGSGRIKYSSAVQRFQASMNSGTYFDISTLSLDSVWMGGRETNALVTPLVVGGSVFDPSVYLSTSSFYFVASAAAGAAGATGIVRLYDVTDAVTICDLSFTSTSVSQQSQVLTVSSPGANSIANSAKVYEIQIFLNAPFVGGSIELYSAAFKVI